MCDVSRLNEWIYITYILLIHIFGQVNFVTDNLWMLTTCLYFWTIHQLHVAPSLVKTPHERSPSITSKQNSQHADRHRHKRGVCTGAFPQPTKLYRLLQKLQSLHLRSHVDFLLSARILIFTYWPRPNTESVRFIGKPLQFLSELPLSRFCDVMSSVFAYFSEHL
jgi:hypothetical protein